MALVDIIEEERKRKEHVRAESTRPQKQCRVGIQSPRKGRKGHTVMTEDQLLTTKEDRFDRPSIRIASEVTDDGEHDCVAQHFREKDPHHGKAARMDDAEVQVDVWNQQMAKPLTLHWASERTQFHLEPKFV